MLTRQLVPRLSIITIVAIIYRIIIIRYHKSEVSIRVVVVVADLRLL